MARELRPIAEKHEAWERLERHLATIMAAKPIQPAPVATEPIATEPMATEPMATEPMLTEPITIEKPKSTRTTRAAQHEVERQTLRQKKKISLKPFGPTDGNKRKSRAKPSSKEKENIAQQEAGITVLDDGTVDIMDTSEPSMDGGLIQWSMVKEYLDAKFLNMEQKYGKLEQQNSEIIKQNTELKENLTLSQQRIEELQVRIHQIQERNSTGLAPYHEAALRGAQTVIPEGPITAIVNQPSLTSSKAEELFCTIDFSHVEGGENVINMAKLRETIEKEIRKKEQWYKCMAITRDHRSQHRVRILCRNEKELDLVKEAANTTASKGTKILRDQLYPVKLNNARADAVLTGPNGTIRTDLIPALEDVNGTQIAKVSWLSCRNAGKAYGSMVVFFTKGSEAERFLREQFMLVGGESACVRVFEPSSALPRCYKCQEFGHKAFNCKKAQRCGNYAQTGHDFSNCHAVPKCASCSGPHTVTSRQCPKRDQIR